MSLTRENQLAPWITTLPQHWKVRRLGSVADVIFSNVDKHTLEGELPVQLCNYTDVYKNDRVTSALEFMQATALPREIERFQIQKGDILATKDSESPNDIAISSFVAEDLPGVLCGYHLAIIRPDKKLLSGNFLAWVQAAKTIRAQYEAQATGVTRYGLGQSAFKETSIPLPPLEKQRRIAAYLDEQTSKIDRLMELRRRQMALLKEQRAAMIQQAVTRGLNLNVPMKDSGLPWLESMPSHWEVKRLKYAVQQHGSGIQMGPFGSMLTSLQSHDTGFKLYGQENTINGDFKLGARWILPTQFQDLKQYEMRPGDIVLTRKGSIGQCRLVPYDAQPGIIDSDTIRLRIDERVILSRFLVRVFHETVYVQDQVLAVRRGAILGGLNTSTIANIVMMIPPVTEQAEIIDFLREQDAKFDTLHAAYAAQLTLLAEYRAALIHECVTGQRPVPGIASA